MTLGCKQDFQIKMFRAINLGWAVCAMIISLSACGILTDSSSSINSVRKAIEPPSIVTWIPPTTYADGTPLVGLSKYRLYYGTSDYLLQAVIDINTTVSSHSFTTSEIDAIGSRMIGNRSHFFALTAIDNDGIESSFSDSFELIPH